jgi:hypothetical protein
MATVRRLAALAADERTDHHERVAAALKACRLIQEGRLFGLEEHERPKYVLKRHEGPWYLRTESDDAYTFVYWRPKFATCGIDHESARELILPRVHVGHVEWMSDDEKKRRLGCCPGNNVAAWFEVAVEA